MRDWNLKIISDFNFLFTSFQHTYEGLKHTSNLREISVCCSVFSIPMRDWNSSTCAARIESWRFSAYLWGIETRSLSPVVPSRSVVFSIPMRDWNSSSRHSLSHRAPSFQHTYEGLKPLLSSSPSLFFFCCFQHTYEGLKHFPVPIRYKVALSVFSIPMRDWNGNKYPIAEIDRKVFSIPMRDWNSSCFYLLVILRPKFSAYLWGIETRRSMTFIPGAIWFSAYLWGIETILGRGTPKSLPLVFSIPMRDWNDFHII